MPTNGTGGSMRRFLSQRLDHPFDEPVSQNSVKLRLNNIALGNFLADEDHDVLPSRSIKITLAAECMDRNERQVRNSFYTALHSIVDRASLSNISLEVSDSYAGSKSWTPRYHEGHVLNLRRCFRDTFKNDNAFYFYMMWLSDYGELELPTRISCQLLDEVRQSLPSMLEQEQRLHRMLLLAYTTDVQHPGYVRLVCPHEVTVSFQEYDQMIQNAWAAIIAITFHSNIPDSGDHPILQLRSLLKSRLHIEHDEIRSLDSNGTHTRFIYRVFSEEETAERHKKMQNDLRSLNETKRPSYHETKEHVEELSDKDVSRFFCEGIPFGSVKKRVRSESMQRYEILLRDMINVFGSKSITFCATNNESITAVQEIVHADFQLYVTLVIHAVSCIASESVYRSLSLHWKENTRLLHNRISFSCRRNTLRDLTDGIIKHIFNPNKEVQSSLSLKILLSGPPGSGKSTFLATAAHILSKHMNKRSVVMVRHIKADSQCKTVVGLLASISSQIALLVPGASTHAQMSAKEHLESISACVIRLCTSNAKFTRDEEHIRFVLLIDDMDILESDAVELLDSWIPVGFHPNFSIIATSSLEFSDRKLIFLRNSGLKLDHVIQIPPFDATLLSDLIDSTATKTDADLQEPIEDMSTIMANTGVFTTKSAPSSRPQTSASVSISLYSENHELKANRTFTDVDICQSIAHEADEFAESSCSDKDSFTIDATMHNILVCATEFNSFELAVEYLRSSSLSAIPKQISTVSFIQKILGSASEEFGVVFVSHIMAYITFSRDCIERSELLALLTSDEEVLAEARNKHYDLYSGSTTIKYPASIINSFLETCILLKIILRRNEDTLRCNCSLLIAAWCCSQHGFDHKFIHSNMAMYFLGSWKCEGLPSQPLEKLLHPAPAQINRRRIREGPYHAILAEEFTLAGQEVARYSYLDTCYRHGQGHEAAYYLKLLAGYIHSDSSKFNDMDLQQRINDYWIFVHCNHQKICVNAQLLYSLACATNPSSSCFDDATLNPQQATQWSSSTIGFRLPRNSSIENLRCCRNLPHIEGSAKLCISSNHRFIFAADDAGFLHKCEFVGQRSHSKSFLLSIKRILSLSCDHSGSSVLILYVDEVMRPTEIPESEANISAHTCNLFAEWPQSICIALFSGTDCSLVLKASISGVLVHSMVATSSLTQVHVGGLNYTEEFLSQCKSNSITAIRSTVDIVNDVDGKFVIGAKDRFVEIYKETKLVQSIIMDRTVSCVAISPDGTAACSLIIGSQVDIFILDRAGAKWAHYSKLQFVSTLTSIVLSTGCLFMLTALDNGCVQVWSVMERKQRRRTNIAFENLPAVHHSDPEAKSSVSRSFIEDGPMQSMICSGLVHFMSFVETNDGFVSVIFDSAGNLAEWNFPYKQLRQPIAIISNRPNVPVYNSLSFTCGLSSEIVWADATAGFLTLLSSSGNMSVISLSCGAKVAQTLLSSNFRISCVNVIEQQMSASNHLRFVLGYQDGCIRLIDHSWACEFEGKIHQATITCMDTLSRPHRIVSLIGFADATLVMFDISTRTKICTLPKQHTASIVSVQMQKDTGLSLAQDRQIIVWDLTLRRVKMVIGSTSNVVACTFALVCTLVYSVLDDGRLRVHSTESQKERFSFTVQPKPTCMHVLESGIKVVCGHQNGDVVVYNVQRRLAAFKLEGHASSISSVRFVIECPFSIFETIDVRNSESEVSLADFSMILSTSKDMSAILWSPLISSNQLNIWNESIAAHAQTDANHLAIHRSVLPQRGVSAIMYQFYISSNQSIDAKFPIASVATVSVKETPEHQGVQDLARIQSRVKSCLRFAEIRKSQIPAIPVLPVTNAQDKEHYLQGSIFQSKSTLKLGKETRKLVDLSLESFKTEASFRLPISNGLTMRQASKKVSDHFPPISTAAISSKKIQNMLPVRHPSSPSDWIAAQEHGSSDDDL